MEKYMENLHQCRHSMLA